MSTREQKIPGPDHPITVTPTGQHVVVKVGDLTVAETDNALTLQESTYPAAQYVPLADVDPAVLIPSDTQTYCPYKGDATYFSIDGPDGEVTDAIWQYAEPYDAVSEIAGHVAFYPDRTQITVG